MNLRATNFEFRHRFWIFVLLFSLAFACYWVDHASTVEVLVRHIARPHSRLSGDTWARLLLLIAAGLVFIAAAIRAWGAAYLSSRVVHDRKVHSDRLVADGPFRYVRNPLYLGNMFFAAGIGMLASPLGFLVLFLGNLIFVLRLILREEEGMRETQGDSYRAYFAAVPRLVPSLEPRVPAAGNRPHWLDGILGEFWVFAWGFGATAPAFTFNLRIYWAVVFGAMLLGAMLRRTMLPPAKAGPPANASG